MAFVAADQERPVELSIIVVSFNTKAETLEALSSLFRYPPSVDFELIVLDNASQDGSLDAIQAQFPQIRAIANPENAGFARGNNIASAYARGRRLLLLNPDTVSLPNSHKAIWDFAERTPDRGIWGGRTLFSDMNLNPTSCWRRMSLWSVFCVQSGLTYLFGNNPVFNPEAYGGWARNTEANVDIVTGCFLLIDADLWRRLGGFDPLFFMYAEEADLCLRARALGARPGITPAAEIIHLGGRSEAIAGRQAVARYVKTARGRVTLMKKHWSAPAVALGQAMMVAGVFSRMIASRFISGRRDAPGQAADKWGEFWRRRHEWLAGYEAPRSAP